MVHRTIENRLSRAALFWRWQSIVKSLATVASIAMLVALVVGGSVVLGWIAEPTPVYLVIGLTVFAAAVGVIARVIVALDKRLDRHWLAASVERDHVKLMDRLNALVELDRQPEAISSAMYRTEIERQTTAMLRQLPDRGPLSRLGARMHVAIAVLLALLTVAFYSHYRPLSLLARSGHEQVQVDEARDVPLTIPELQSDDPSDAQLADEDPSGPWGEVRISEPGRDLRVTQEEDIPLLIEAAADRPLDHVFWVTSVNRQEEINHGLAELDDPRYGVFQPMLKPYELELKAWDLVSYRAVAVAADRVRYESPFYFVEIIPSRDQLDELSESAYEQLEQMSDLIDQQQEVIRQTHRLTQSDPSQQGRWAEALAEQEDRIKKSTEQQQVAMASRLWQSEADALADEFAKAMSAAQESLRDAETALTDHSPAAAADPERRALIELAEARRHLADLVRSHADAFEPSALTSQLEQLQNRSDGLKEARQSVQQTLAQQREIQNEANRDRRQKQSYPSLSEQQAALEKSLAQSIRQNQAGFEQAAEQCQGATTGMRQAAQALRAGDEQATQQAEHAAEQLRQLDETLRQQQEHSQISEEQLVREMLKQLDRRLEEIAKNPKQVTSEQKQQTASQCNSVGSKACELAGNSGGSSSGAGDGDKPSNADANETNPGGGQTPGAEAGDREQQIASASDRLANSVGNAGTASAARDLQQQLRQLADELQPRSPSSGTAAAQSPGESGEGDSLRPDGGEAIERGLSQLESAARRSEQGTLSSAAAKELRSGGAADMSAGIASRYGYNENSRAMMREVDDLLADPTSPVDLKTLQQLREQIQSLQSDLLLRAQPEEIGDATRFVDPARYPPDYRDSIRQYFEKLSEHR